jgi:hypothetical protein
MRTRKRSRKISFLVSVLRALACLAFLSVLSCTKAAPREEDAGSVASSAAPSALPVPVDSGPPMPPVFGEWERATEPYQGMRIAIRGESGVVTRAPPAEPRSGLSKAQLECQRSLWRIGEELITGLHEGDGKILVRDWGVAAGTCRHADSRAPARLAVVDGALNIDVTRGKTTVTQRWIRVGAL